MLSNMIIAGIFIVVGALLITFGILFLIKSQKKTWKIILGIIMILIGLSMFLQGLVSLWVLKALTSSPPNLNVGLGSN